MGKVVHFECFVPDPAAAAAFYRDVFGWGVQAWEGGEDYQLVTSGGADESALGGAFTVPGAAGEQRVALTLAVDDLEAAIARATEAGATLVQEPAPIQGVGDFAYMADPAGIVFGVLQPEMAGGEPAGDRGAWEDVGERLRELGASVAQAFGETASSPQAQRVRDEAEKAAASIRQASSVAADRARPYVVSALDRVSAELDQLAVRLRGEQQDESRGPDEEPLS